MSVVAVRAALETAINSISPGIAWVFENDGYDPSLGAPYGVVRIVFAEPDNNEYGNHYTIVGFVQIDLNYPLKGGTGALEAQYEVIRAALYRGASFVSGGVTTTVQRTPELGPDLEDGERYVRPVRIRFFAPIA